MAIANHSTGTRIDEVGEGIYRINTPVPPTVIPGGFSFNQYLVVDEEPLLFHTGSRRLFPVVMEAIKKVLPVERLRHVGFSHYEQDECGALSEFLAAAPRSAPVCSFINGLINADGFDRPARALRHMETLQTGKRKFRWLDTPHLPHAWECGYLFEETTETLFCGDLFTQPGHETEPLTEGDILGPSVAMQTNLDYWAHSKHSHKLFAMLAELKPRTLACMHGSAWRGNGAALLLELAKTV